MWTHNFFLKLLSCKVKLLDKAENYILHPLIHNIDVVNPPILMSRFATAYKMCYVLYRKYKGLWSVIISNYTFVIYSLYGIIINFLRIYKMLLKFI